MDLQIDGFRMLMLFMNNLLRFVLSNAVCPFITAVFLRRSTRCLEISRRTNSDLLGKFAMTCLVRWQILKDLCVANKAPVSDLDSDRGSLDVCNGRLSCQA